MVFLFLLISFAASVVGAICGIGGGVLIKPCLDVLRLASVSAISFLSSSTVLAMSSYSVGRSLLSGDRKVDLRVATPLAIGAALGGVAGQHLFQAIKTASSYPTRVGVIQSICLALVTAGTLVYTLLRGSLRSLSVSAPAACGAIGVLLGVISSFLGIGGGPINLVVLYSCFSLDTKTAAQNSLFVILFSQIANIGSYLLTRTVPRFEPLALILMLSGGIGGAIVGRAIYRRIDNRAVEKLFRVLMAAIICICVYNAFQYSRSK